MTRKLFSAVIAVCLFALSSCSLPGLNNSTSKDAIIVAASNSTEGKILGSIVQQLVQHDLKLSVQVISNLGTTTIIHNSMMKGDVNISAVRYTGTDVTGTLGLPAEKDPTIAYETVVREFASRYNQTWFPSYGFDNTYVFTVSRSTAEKYNLKTISDLKAVADQLSVGVDTSWLNREGDGYSAFKAAYGFDFKTVYPMQVSLVYDAVDKGNVDVVLAYSTDGRIASYDLVMLEDDLKFFPPYDASVVASNDILDLHPGLRACLAKLSGKITTEIMQTLNYESDNSLIEPEVVAKQFLEANNYFETGGGA